MIEYKNMIVVGDRVLIKQAELNDKTPSGLYLPPTVKEKEQVQTGYIIKVGPGYPVASANTEDEPWKQEKDTKYIPLQAKEGDYVLYMKKDSIEIELNGEDLLILPQHAILLIIRDEGLFE